jgi:hypothetical protein
MLLAGKNAGAGTSPDMVFEQNAWNAIVQKEKTKGSRQW